MEVDCRGCAGCCLDWRPIAPAGSTHERTGTDRPLDDRYNLVPLTRDDVRDLVDAGYGDALRPRVWTTDDENRQTVTVDDVPLVAVDGRPLFMVGLRQPPKPVGPFDTDPQWLRTCVFLDPATLQCRIHDEAIYPDTCAAYPGQHLALETETECERVEAAFGGDRLLDTDVPGAVPPLPVGPRAIGWTVFAHPAPDELAGRIDRVRTDDLRNADRAAFAAVAAGHSPGTFAVNDAAVEEVRKRVLAADSWVGRAAASWAAAAGAEEPPDPARAADIEEARGAPATPGWSDEANAIE